MKKLIVIAAILLAGLSAFAQEKKITLPEKPNRAKYVDYSAKQTGWWCAVQATGAISATSKGACAWLAQLDIINGYRFSEFLKVGVGVSPRFFFPQEGFPLSAAPRILGIYSVPIYADARGNFISQEDRMFAPYWNVDLGYAIGEGIYFSPCMGMKFGDTRNNFLVGLAYILQGHRAAGFNAPVHIFGLRLGYEF